MNKPDIQFIYDPAVDEYTSLKINETVINFNEFQNITLFGLISEILKELNLDFDATKPEVEEIKFENEMEMYDFMENQPHKTDWINADDPKRLRVGFYDSVNCKKITISYRDIVDKTKYESFAWRNEFCKRINEKQK